MASTYANLGRAYRNLGEDEKARESYDQALRLNPDQSNAYLGLGQLLEKQNRLDEAIGNYSKSVELRPVDTDFCSWVMRSKSSRRPEALAAYENALKLSPDLQEAQSALDACLKSADFHRTRSRPENYFFSLISIVARVFSQSRFMAHRARLIETDCEIFHRRG